jgi:hypothetical protein
LNRDEMVSFISGFVANGVQSGRGQLKSRVVGNIKPPVRTDFDNPSLCQVPLAYCKKVSDSFP